MSDVKPRFHKNEIVRVVRLTGASEEERWVLSQEVVVNSYVGPDDSEQNWALTAWVDEPEPEGRTLWVFSEPDLESTGWIEVDETGRRERRAASLPEPATIGDVISFRLIMDVMDSDSLDRVAAGIRASLHSLAPAASIDARVVDRSEYGEEAAEKDYSEILADLEVSGRVMEVVSKLIAADRSAWELDDDNGWRFHLSWTKNPHSPESVLLTPAVREAEVVVLPWSVQGRRSEAIGVLLGIG